jgi:hypothetical protein
MRRFIRIFDEVAFYLGILAITYVWLGFVIVSILTYVNEN